MIVVKRSMLLVIGALGLVVAGCAFGFSDYLYLRDFTHNSFWIAKGAENQAVMCWEDGCAESVGPTESQLQTDIKNSSSSAFIKELPNLPVSDKQKILKYRPTLVENHSPLKSFVKNQNHLLFSMVEEFNKKGHHVTKWTIYYFDLNTGYIKEVWESTSPMYAIAIDREAKDPEKAITYASLHEGKYFVDYIPFPNENTFTKTMSNLYKFQRELRY